MNQIPARVGHKSTGQVLASKSDSIEDQEAVQNTDAKYQEIFLPQVSLFIQFLGKFF